MRRRSEPLRGAARPHPLVDTPLRLRLPTRLRLPPPFKSLQLPPPRFKVRRTTAIYTKALENPNTLNQGTLS